MAKPALAAVSSEPSELLAPLIAIAEEAKEHHRRLQKLLKQPGGLAGPQVATELVDTMMSLLSDSTEATAKILSEIEDWSLDVERVLESDEQPELGLLSSDANSLRELLLALVAAIDDEHADKAKLGARVTRQLALLDEWTVDEEEEEQEDEGQDGEQDEETDEEAADAAPESSQN